jgi:hypothetical protein
VSTQETRTREPATAELNGHEPTIRDLTVQLGDRMTRLLREELALAKVEAMATARQAVLGGGMFAAAALLGVTAWLALIAAAIAGIAAALPVWASALIVGAALAALAGAFAIAAGHRVSRGVPPLRMTADSLRRDVLEVKDDLRAGRERAAKVKKSAAEEVTR